VGEGGGLDYGIFWVCTEKAFCATRPLHTATLRVVHVQVVQAMCHLLSMVLPRAQPSVLRAKFVGATSLLAGLLEEHRQQVRSVVC